MVRRRFGENGAERGRGFGPWTVHAIFSAVEGAIKDLVMRDLDGSISRYEDPLAEGISPVFKTDAAMSFDPKTTQKI